MKFLCNRVTLGTLSICILIFLLAMFAVVSAGNIAEQAGTRTLCKKCSRTAPHK